ncbi:MAG: undecaprenyl-diphosphate phosphatase [Acidimicrobiia bacterium]|nr:undecaprenyl-diphosphate phosphatase [Acidimicrobiia bacterium]
MLQDIVLGIVQGLTEFLPVSSSGHLVVVPALFGWEQPSLTFDLVLHLGTLLAVVFAFRADLVALVLGLLGRGPDPTRARRLLGLLVVGSIPAGVAGLALGSFFEDLFERPGWVCGFWVVTALILLAADRHVERFPATTDTVGTRSAVGMGVAQAAAITPGISRSGTTIAAGVGFGLTRTEAARFSFLLSIPAILGAVITQIPDVTGGEFDLTASVAAGFVAALVSGWLAIEGFLRFLRTHSLRAFALYLLVVAPVSAVLLWLT